MKLGSAPRNDPPSAHKARKTGAWGRLSALVEDTASLEELEEAWPEIQAEAETALPPGWQQELRQVYRDHREALFDLHHRQPMRRLNGKED